MKNYLIAKLLKSLGEHHKQLTPKLKMVQSSRSTSLNCKEEYFYCYSADAGEAAYRKARQQSVNTSKFLEYFPFVEYADEKMLNDKWSPDAIVGHARKHKLFPLKNIPCTKTLYNWIDQGLMKTINLDLLLKIKRKPKQRRIRKNKTCLGESIEKRPTIVDDPEEFGHWEIDTVVGLKKGGDAAIMTLIERKTRFEIIMKIDSKASDPVNKAILSIKEQVGDHFTQLFKTITSDNGVEFAGIYQLLKGKVKVYFSHLYSSWERASNENHNGIIRRFIPKGTKVANVLTAMIQKVQNWMNDLPRKILKYATPREKFIKEFEQLELSQNS